MLQACPLLCPCGRDKQGRAVREPEEPPVMLAKIRNTGKEPIEQGIRFFPSLEGFDFARLAPMS